MSQDERIDSIVGEELPMTYQVAMIGSDGWILASDGQATIQGGLVRRTSYQTQKIRYEDGVASAPFGDECAQITRDRIVAELKPDPNKLAQGAFHRELERFAERVWRAEFRSQNDGRPRDRRIRATRDRGIILLAKGSKSIFILGIGKQSNLSISITQYPAGDPTNPISFIAERYYDKSFTVNQLAVLATHCVVQASRFNALVSGLHGLAWREGEPDAQWLDEPEYIAHSQRLESTFFDALIGASNAELKTRPF